jgi:betaine-aldehyde dehydrogenase
VGRAGRRRDDGGAEPGDGGYKESGYGKDLSVYSLEDYTQIKHVMAKLD